jgi:hypothetical protein
MVKKALFLGLMRDIIHPHELYDLNDDTLFSLAHNNPFKPFTLLTFVSTHNLYHKVYSEPFNPENNAHTNLENLSFRMDIENLIARELSDKTGIPVHTEDIIIDIPEKISFEIDVPVHQDNNRGAIWFENSGSVFTPDTISNFVHTLRHITISIRKDEILFREIKKLDIRAIIRSRVDGY